MMKCGMKLIIHFQTSMVEHDKQFMLGLKLNDVSKSGPWIYYTGGHYPENIIKHNSSAYCC